MKLNPAKIAAIAALIAASVVMSGCVVNKQVLNKSTVFGFQASTPELGYGAISVQLGLIRNEYWSNPTSTNAIYAPPFNSSVKADLHLTHQTADESFGSK